MAIHFFNPRATFIHIPKTGGTSFTEWCKSNFVIKNDFIRVKKHINPENLIKEYDIQELGYTFTFVRNPYDRFVSMFHFIGQRAVERIEIRNSGIKKKVKSTQEHDLVLREFYNKGFKKYVEALYYDYEHPFRNNATFSDPITYNQLYYIAGNIKVENIFKIEELDTEFFRIQKFLNCDDVLPQVNTTTRTDYRHYFDQESKKMFDRLFEEELEYLKYSF